MTIQEAIKELNSSGTVRFSRLISICEHFFGSPRIRGSHHIFATGVPDYPIINLQPQGNDAKVYQVRQVVKVLESFS